MFSNAQEIYNIGASGNYFFDASGLRRQGSVLNRVGVGFMFTDYTGYVSSSSGFNLNPSPTPFQYIVQPSSVASIFNTGRYRYYTSIPSLGSGLYNYPSAPMPPTPSPDSSENNNNNNNNNNIGSGLL